MKRSRAQSGFGLVEVLVAVALLGVAVASVSSLVGHVFQSVGSNSLRGHSIVLAREELEQIRAMPYPAMADRSRTESWNGTSYRVDTVVEDDQPGPSMKRVTVTVSWLDHGRAGSYEIATIYTSVQR